MIENVSGNKRSNTMSKLRNKKWAEGVLFRCEKWSGGGPAYEGRIQLSRHMLMFLMKRLDENGGDDLRCDLWGWNHYQSITVELGPPLYEPKEKDRITLEGLFDE
jgi:hypothetical protein